MDIKKLLETFDSINNAEKNSSGPKFPGYWKGKDSASKAKGHMVGGTDESILKDLSKGPNKDRKHEQELSEAWLEFKEAAPVPGQPAAAPGATPAPAPGATAAPATPPKPGQPVPLDPKVAAAIKTSATAIKQAAPNANPAQLAKAAASIESGVAPSTTDKNAIANSLADPLANIMQNPQMANQFKEMIKKAGTLDAAADKAAGTTTPTAPVAPGAPVPPAGTQPK
jgi:hypothetical protein